MTSRPASTDNASTDSWMPSRTSERGSTSCTDGHPLSVLVDTTEPFGSLGVFLLDLERFFAFFCFFMAAPSLWSACGFLTNASYRSRLLQFNGIRDDLSGGTYVGTQDGCVRREDGMSTLVEKRVYSLIWE